MKSPMIIALAFLLSPLTVFAGTYGDLSYTSDDSTITITDCETSVTNVVIPDTINDLPVTSIGNYAFYSCADLSNVTIPNSITNIGNSAFLNCISLSSIVIPDSVINMGYWTFQSCTNLSNATLGNSITRIGGAFNKCTSLKSITIPDSVTSIGWSSFYTCTSLTNLWLGSGVTNIEDEAFRLCNSLPEINVDPENAYYSSLDGILFNKKRTSVIQCPAGKTGSYAIPDAVTNIGYAAFNNTGLTNVFIPAGVVNIGDWAFEWSTNISDINVNDANPFFSSTNGILFNKDLTTIIQYPGGKTNSTYAIPDSVVNIGGGAFSFSYHLSEIPILNGVTNIGPAAFRDCLGFNEIIIPDSVIKLEWMCFYNCANVTNVVIGQNVTGIGSGYHYGVFESCTNLTRFTISDSVTNICYRCFASCTGLTNVIIGQGISSIGNYAFDSCPSLKYVFFEGDKPAVETYTFPIDSKASVYYLPGSSGWGTTLSRRPVKLWNPIMQLGEEYGATTNGFCFNISGTVNIPIKIETCTDLTEGNWVPLQFTKLSDGSLDFIDPAYVSHPMRAYRIAAP